MKPTEWQAHEARQRQREAFAAQQRADAVRIERAPAPKAKRLDWFETVVAIRLPLALLVGFAFSAALYLLHLLLRGAQ